MLAFKASALLTEPPPHSSTERHTFFVMVGGGSGEAAEQNSHLFWGFSLQHNWTQQVNIFLFWIELTQITLGGRNPLSLQHWGLQIPSKSDFQGLPQLEKVYGSLVCPVRVILVGCFCHRSFWAMPALGGLLLPNLVISASIDVKYLPSQIISTLASEKPSLLHPLIKGSSTSSCCLKHIYPLEQGPMFGFEAVSLSLDWPSIQQSTWGSR